MGYTVPVMDFVPQDQWRARPVKLGDGDSFDVVVDQRLDVLRLVRVRVFGVDAPETRSADPVERAAGAAARAYIHSWLMYDVGVEWPLVIKTYKKDSFGRWLVDVSRVSDGHDMGVELLETGHAVVYVKK